MIYQKIYTRSRWVSELYVWKSDAWLATHSQLWKVTSKEDTCAFALGVAKSEITPCHDQYYVYTTWYRVLTRTIRIITPLTQVGRPNFDSTQRCRFRVFDAFNSWFNLCHCHGIIFRWMIANDGRKVLGRTASHRAKQQQQLCSYSNEGYQMVVILVVSMAGTDD